MATPKSSDYLDRVHAKIVEKNTAVYNGEIKLIKKHIANNQREIDEYTKQLTDLQSNIESTIAAATVTDMEKALNKLVEMGAIDETERDAAYKKFGIKKGSTAPRRQVSYRPPC